MKFILIYVFILMSSIYLCPITQKPDSIIEDSIYIDTSRFVADNYNRLAIDTTGPEPEISIIVRTNGRFDQLDSMGINTGGPGGSRRGDEVHIWVPIRILSEIRNLESVINIRYGLRAVYHDLKHENTTEPGTGVVYATLPGIISHHEKTLRLILIRTAPTKSMSEESSPSSFFHKEVSISSTGLCRISNIPPGVYSGLITSGCTDSTMSYEKVKERSIVIDSIRVKAGFVSLVFEKGIRPISVNESDHYVWLESFRSLDE